MRQVDAATWQLGQDTGSICATRALRTLFCCLPPTPRRHLSTPPCGTPSTHHTQCPGLTHPLPPRPFRPGSGAARSAAAPRRRRRRLPPRQAAARCGSSPRCSARCTGCRWARRGPARGGQQAGRSCPRCAPTRHSQRRARRSCRSCCRPVRPPPQILPSGRGSRGCRRLGWGGKQKAPGGCSRQHRPPQPPGRCRRPKLRRR